MKHFLKILIISFIILSAFLTLFSINQATAVDPLTGSGPGGTPLTAQAGTAGVRNLIGVIIKSVLGVMGSCALLMVIYGGIVLLSSGGINENIQKGKRILFWSAGALILIIFSYTIIDFVIKALTPN